jgi:hypothetical protein
MGLNRLPSGRFARNPEQARNAAREQLKIILANEEALMSIRGGCEKFMKARELDEQLRIGEYFTWQYDAIDKIYESTMRALGYESISTHVDRKRKSLRYG